MKLYTSKEWLLDLIFPRFCLGCKTELNSGSGFVCVSCFEKINLVRGIHCHICGLRNIRGPRHSRGCRKKTALKGLYAAGHYQDPVLREMIHAFKYHSIEILKKPLAELVIAYIQKELFTNQPIVYRLKDCVLVPVPLTLRRKINRGFNQSELLALEIAKYLDAPVMNLLKRNKFTGPQAEISDWKKRKENISGVFALSPVDRFPKPIDYFKVILVDDVSTSGATLEEAARVLKQAGVKEVYGLVVAKG